MESDMGLETKEDGVGEYSCWKSEIPFNWKLVPYQVIAALMWAI